MNPIIFKRNNFNSTFAQEAKNKHNLTQEEILLGIPTLSNITSDSINSPESYAWEAIQQILLTGKQLYLDIHIYNFGASCSILYQYPFGIRIRSFINNNDKILSNTPPLLNSAISSNFGIDFYSGGEVNPEWTEISNVIDNKTLLRNEGIISVGGIVGKIEHMPFRIADLPFGWYACDGSLYPIQSKEGIALSDLPPNYKLDWNILITENNINVPMLTEGGIGNEGGAFFRSVPDGQQGREQKDAMRNTKGSFKISDLFTSSPVDALGSFLKTLLISSPGGVSPGGASASEIDVTFSAQDSAVIDKEGAILQSGTLYDNGYIASENRSYNKGMLPCIYLGV